MMRILLDTNIFIPIEPASSGDIERNTSLGLELIRLCGIAGHQVLIHPHVASDLARDKDKARASLRQALSERYQKLEHIVPIPVGWKDIIGDADEHSNDWVDHHLLAAVSADAVHVLISEDIRLRKKARKLNINKRVWSLSYALETFRVLTDQPIDPQPNLELVKLYSIDDGDPIFDSIRQDYGRESFNKWLEDSKQGGREALVIRAAYGESLLAGIVILKPEQFIPGVRTGKTLKVCTFKVGDTFGKNRFGELLLKGIFDYAKNNEYDLVYFTAFQEKQTELLGFSESFGFRLSPEKTQRNELIVYKDLRPKIDDRRIMSPWDFHVRYGPWNAKLESADAFIIPIQPKFYSLLFPEGVSQQSLLPPKPCGNGIKKAYLCHSKITKLKCGDSLYFYNSIGNRDSGISAIGITEDIMRTRDDSLLIRFVGNRTVYTNQQIKELCQKDVLAIRFRRVRLLKHTIKKDKLMDFGIIGGAPQSISQIPSERIKLMADLCNE